MEEILLPTKGEGSSSLSSKEEWLKPSPAAVISPTVLISEGRHRHLVKIMQSKMRSPPLSHGSNGEISPFIFKLPQGIADINRKYYHPELVSIGPYHHGKDHLREAQADKWPFLDSMFFRMGERGLDSCIDLISGTEPRIRSSYSGDINFDSDQFVEMMVLDGCFIIEFLVKATTDSNGFDPDKSIFGKRRMLLTVMRDLIKFENQIPYFVLENLLPLLHEEINLPKVLLRFFNKVFGIPEYSDMGRHHLHSKPHHILDILRSTLVPTGAVQLGIYSKFRKIGIKVADCFRSRTDQPSEIKQQLVHSATGETSRPTSLRRKKGIKVIDFWRSCLLPNGEEQRHPVLKNIFCASVLRKKGIKIRAGAFLGLSDIKFRKGVLWIPSLVFDDFTCTAILNCMAYEQEQCYTSLRDKPMYITGFAVVLDSLINTAEDVRILRDRNVIDHFFGTDEEVAQFCNNLGKGSTLDTGMDDVWGMFEDINSYCKASRNMHWASFKQTYFGTPWIFFSALAAIILLLLTMAQTFFSVFTYFHPRS